MTRIVDQSTIELALESFNGKIVPSHDADIHAALDRAADLATEHPGIRVTRMTFEVTGEDAANALRRYLTARVRDDKRVVGDYGGIEVEMVEVRR
jgi:hypothetical protein